MSSPWNTVRRLESKNENVLKYVFEASDAVAESVLYKYPTYNERTVICCSTQSGCPVGCRFCGAGDSFVRSLTAEEIVGQVQHLFADKNIDPIEVDRMQIMFMSMGEPLLNQRGLIGALRKLHLDYPRAALLISTSAPRVDYQPIIDISKEIPKIGLQFSVHESTDEARNQLIPFEKKLSLREIAVAGEDWCADVGRRPFFNYCAHAGNSSAADADRLLALFDPLIWECTVSVVCERNDGLTTLHDKQQEVASSFMSLMIARGYSTRMFDPAGQEIAGGCGQLWQTQEWMRQHPKLARPSIGRGLPIMHAPSQCDNRDVRSR